MINTFKIFIITVLKYIILYVVMLYKASNFEKIEVKNISPDSLGNNVLWINKEFIFGNYNIKIFLFSSIISLLIAGFYFLLKKKWDNKILIICLLTIVSLIFHYLFFHKMYLYEHFFYDSFDRQKLILFNFIIYLLIFVAWIIGVFFIEKKKV